MKVLHFTHSQDIDGMNCAILGSEAFNDYTVIPTKTFEITEAVKKYIDNKSIYNYDLVIVTDLCIKEPLLTKIAHDERLKNKIIILDHHLSEIKEGNDKYDFVHIIVEHNGRKESGTSLFYAYLLEKNYLKRTKFLDTLVELTRSYDVWDWQKDGKINARKLHIIFETQGLDKYMHIIENKLKNSEDLIFDSNDEKIINKFEKELTEAVNKYIKNIKVVNITINDKTYRVGYTHILYKYRNDINEVIMHNNKDNLDAIGLIIDDRDTVSYRQTKKDVDVSLIATYFDGKGHFAAAGHPQLNEKFQKFVRKHQL